MPILNNNFSKYPNITQTEPNKKALPTITRNP